MIDDFLPQEVDQSCFKAIQIGGHDHILCVTTSEKESFFEGQSAPWDSAKKDENRMKNRYGNIIACKLVNCPSGLTVLLLNARSVHKSSLNHDLIVDEGANLAYITKTWAGDVSLSQLCPPGYLVQQQPRLEGRGGGVALVYRASISLTGLPVLSRPDLECLYLVLGNRDRLGILLVYRVPFCPTDSLPELTEIVSDLVLRTPRMLVLGDFSLHVEMDLTRAAQNFMASMTAMGLSQHVSGLTHERGHTLDLVFSTGQEEVI
ncbi:Receptor-type tyrosine-protein phosphatase mu [Varanus komodoensis]|nr:Receptor-type tyrosine-protein phosphatase mu [Varanus komodoensis]